MNSENKTSKSKEKLHNESLWSKTSSISTVLNEDSLTVIKSKGNSKQDFYYPTNLRLSGDFEINMEIKSENGKYITFILNRTASYGGSVFGWRNINKWTHLKVIRKNGELKVFYNYSRKPQVIRENHLNNLLFIIRFNGFEDENTLEYRNLKVNSNGRIIFTDVYVNDDQEILNNKVQSLTNKVNDFENTMNSYMNFSLLDTDIKTSGALYYAQNLCQEILDFIVKICEKYDIEYWLDFGTLLGAVRHEGFIPWDDDIDLGMMREDFNKFLSVVPEEVSQSGLKDNIYVKIDVPIGKGKWARTFLQIVYMDDDRNALSWVDIFAYDYIKDYDENISKKYFKERKEFNRKILDGINRNIVEKETYENLNLSYEKQSHLIHGVDGAQGNSEKDMPFDIFEDELIHPLVTKKYNNKEYLVPNDYDTYLKRLYGNYLIPVVNQKHGQKDYIRTRKDMDSYCIGYLNRIKEINNNPLINENIQDYDSRLNNIESEISSLKEQNDEKNKEIESLKQQIVSANKELDEYTTSFSEQLKTIYMYYDMKPKGVLKYSQSLCQELLNWVVKVCEKYDIEYWLDYGTLLGAIRHKGFVPWDDDIDLGMMREDFNKFAEVMNEEIKENNMEEYMNINLDRIGSNNNIIPFIQIFFTPDYNRFYAGLDVFPYDYMTDKNTCDKDIFLKEKKSFNHKLNDENDRNNLINEIYEKFGLSYEKQDYILPGVDNARGGYYDYKYDVYDFDTLYPLKTIEFNDVEYNCPNDIDTWLTSIYDKYYNFPKIIHHHHHRLDFLNKKPETFENYEKYLRLVKEIIKKY